MDLQHKDLTEQIIGAAFEVHRELGYGFLEKVYQRAMVVELGMRGIFADPEAPIKVQYKGVEVGTYEADLLVQQCVLVELKIARDYCTADEAQLLNELKATGIKLDFLSTSGEARSSSSAWSFDGKIVVTPGRLVDQNETAFIRVSSVSIRG